MWHDLLLALALVMVLEGLLPALNPRAWRNAVEQLGSLSDGAIRRFGMVLVISGALLFHFIR